MVLMEIACEPDSRLAAAVGYGAPRCGSSLWNHCDLGTHAGVKLIIERLHLERPQNVWISPPCGPFSPLQNGNPRTEAQRQELHEKHHAAIRICVGAGCIFHECVKLGIHAT